MADIRRALLVVDVQNDFCEGGSLAVRGGAAVAARITGHLADHAADYVAVLASRDWHDPDSDNGGHFAERPDFASTWPPHCVAGTAGAEYHPGLDATALTHQVRKGQGEPAYSAFQGRDERDVALPRIVRELGVTALDVCGIATDYCVRASALDALGAGLDVRLLLDLCAGVAPDSSRAAVATIEGGGGVVVTDPRRRE